MHVKRERGRERKRERRGFNGGVKVKERDLVQFISRLFLLSDSVAEFFWEVLVNEVR